MTILEYEAQFHELARHTITIFLINYKCIWCFVQGLRLRLCIDTQSFVATRMSFIKVSDYD